MLELFRGYVAQVKADPSIEESDKTMLDIVVQKRVRKFPLPPPDVYPALWIRGVMNCMHEIGYKTMDAMNRRGKPRSATHLVLLCHVGDAATIDPKDARYVGAFTRYPIRVQYQPAQSGQTATYFGAWLSRSGAQTPWSPGVSMPIVSSARYQPGAKRAA